MDSQTHPFVKRKNNRARPPNTRMLDIGISLIVGFALGYAVREWAFRQSHAQQRRRRPF